MTLAESVVRVLTDQSLTIACAETHTGGGITQSLIRVPGSSRVLGFSAVVYSDRSKAEVLGVDPSIIQQSGAVSEEAALAMAEGAAALGHADLGLAVTGVAGPGGGTPEKPVGMVCFALRTADRSVTRTCRYGDLGRDSVIDRSVITALKMVAEHLGNRGYSHVQG